MLRSVPDYDTATLKGFHIVNIREVNPGPSNQPGFMWQSPSPADLTREDEGSEDCDQRPAPGM